MPRASSKSSSTNSPSTESASATSLENLLKSRLVWRASGIQDLRQERTVKTGYKQLDPLLADGGWPTQGLTEILHDQPGMGEFRILMPALAHLSQTQSRWLLLVAPPYIPYAPALSQAGVNLTRLLIVNPEHSADQLWVLEQALASNSCSAVMAWPQNHHSLTYKQLRRLQVASKNGDCLGVLYRNIGVAQQPSPAELRIQLKAASNTSALNDHSVLDIQILKRKGGLTKNTLQLELKDNLTQATPDFNELKVQQWHQDDPDLVYMDPEVQHPGYQLQ